MATNECFVDRLGRLIVGKIKLDFEFVVFSKVDDCGDELIYATLENGWHWYIRDEFGNNLEYRCDSGYWYRCTRDVLGNVLNYNNSTGYWFVSERDEFGNEISFSDSDSKHLEK